MSTKLCLHTFIKMCLRRILLNVTLHSGSSISQFVPFAMIKSFVSPCCSAGSCKSDIVISWTSSWLLKVTTGGSIVILLPFLCSPSHKALIIKYMTKIICLCWYVDVLTIEIKFRYNNWKNIVRYIDCKLFKFFTFSRPNCHCNFILFHDVCFEWRQ